MAQRALRKVRALWHEHAAIRQHHRPVGDGLAAAVVCGELTCGQMPANTRNKVDLPQPDGPRISTVSPAAALSDVSASNTSPLGSEMVSGVVCSRLMSVADGANDGPSLWEALALVCTAFIWSWNDVKRSVVACHDAKRL